MTCVLFTTKKMIRLARHTPADSSSRRQRRHLAVSLLHYSCQNPQSFSRGARLVDDPSLSQHRRGPLSPFSRTGIHSPLRAHRMFPEPNNKVTSQPINQRPYQTTDRPTFCSSFRILQISRQQVSMSIPHTAVIGGPTELPLGRLRPSAILAVRRLPPVAPAPAASPFDTIICAPRVPLPRPLSLPPPCDAVEDISTCFALQGWLPVLGTDVPWVSRRIGAADERCVRLLCAGGTLAVTDIRK